MTTNHKQPVTEKFDQQKTQDLLNITTAQRDRAMNICVQLEAEVLSRDRTIAQLKKRKRKKTDTDTGVA